MEYLESIWPAVTFLVLYTGFIFAGFNWMLKAQTKQINVQIEPIKELLTNHITDTDKKIDAVRAEVREVRAEVKEVRAEVREVNAKLDKLISRSS